jgi:transglutaminase-like putative cysteine protease
VLELTFKCLAWALMIAVPLLGVWAASSLAAYANARVGWVVASGVLLFPGLPLAWEGFAAWRRKARGVTKKRFLTFGDRLVLRTLFVNVVFLTVLIASRPKVAFVALSARGDWFLGDHHGAAAERTRKVAFKLAGGLEWLYTATHPNPYDKYKPEPHPEPTTSAAPTASAAPSTSASSSTAPAPTTPPAWPTPKALHPVIATIPPEAEQSIEGVAKYIAGREQDPLLRVKALHDWVVDHIVYDAPAFLSGNIPQEDGDAQQTFTRRLGVCAGYAQLMVSLGKVTGDEIVYVVGNVRTLDSSIDGMSHAWNGARIDGRWYLIDPTFDAGYLEGDHFKKRYTTDYLFTPPEIFLVSHFPEDGKWQLRDAPISRGDFIRQPMLQPAFFARHIELVDPDRSQVTVQGHFDVRLRNAATNLLMDYRPAQADHGVGTQCNVDGFVHASCELPAGSWHVLLFGSDERYGTYEHLGTFEVNSR